jgi:hypothetical protein
MKCSKLFEVYKRVNAIFILLEVRGFTMDFVQDNSEIVFSEERDWLMIHNVDNIDSRKEIAKVLKRNRLESTENGDSILIPLNFHIS